MDHSSLQRVVRVKKTDEAEEEGVELSQEEITALSHGMTSSLGLLLKRVGSSCVHEKRCPKNEM